MNGGSVVRSSQRLGRSHVQRKVDGRKIRICESPQTEVLASSCVTNLDGTNSLVKGLNLGISVGIWGSRLSPPKLPQHLPVERTDEKPSMHQDPLLKEYSKARLTTRTILLNRQAA